MAERAENTESDAAQAGSRSKGGLVLWVVVALASIGGGFATPFLVLKSSGEDTESSAAAEPGAPPALVEFGEVVVNLNETRLNRYLRLNISLLTDEASKAVVIQAVEKNKPVLKSWLLGYLADKGMDDIRGATGQNQLRREIQNHFNSVMFPGGGQPVRNILFQEFNIQ